MIKNIGALLGGPCRIQSRRIFRDKRLDVGFINLRRCLHFVFLGFRLFGAVAAFLGGGVLSSAESAVSKSTPSGGTMAAFRPREGSTGFGFVVASASPCLRPRFGFAAAADFRAAMNLYQVVWNRYRELMVLAHLYQVPRKFPQFETV
jgi:hypothetical protein